MVLGQSAALAAGLAIDNDTAVQDVDVKKLQERLLAAKQVLAWNEPRRADAIDPAGLPGIVADDTQAQREGDWIESTAIGPFIGRGYLHDENAGKGDKSLRFKLTVKTAGHYEARLAYTPNPNRATNVPVAVEIGGATTTTVVNQRQPPAIDGRFVSLGRFDLKAGETMIITIMNRDTDGYVVVDAVQITGTR